VVRGSWDSSGSGIHGRTRPLLGRIGLRLRYEAIRHNPEAFELASFSNSSIFMNIDDKRLCFTDAKNYRLVSRKILENK